VICENAPGSAEQQESQHDWQCRWTRVSGPVINGRVSSTLVWLCEYPYRTMMTEPPEPGTCGGCPVRGETIARAAVAPRAQVFKKAAGF
jgi:hypothetical protein